MSWGGSIASGQKSWMGRPGITGYSRKTVKTQLGEVDIKVPRDRQGKYEPKIISKYDRNAEGMEAVFPNSRLQRCIVHQIRVSTRYVSYKDIKQVIADLKKIYKAVILDEAENNLLAFCERWRGQYPSCVKSWEEKWEVLVGSI